MEFTNIQEYNNGKIFLQNFKGEVFYLDQDSIKEDKIVQQLDFKIEYFKIIGDYFYYQNRQYLFAYKPGEGAPKDINTLELQNIDFIASSNGYFRASPSPYSDKNIINFYHVQNGKIKDLNQEVLRFYFIQEIDHQCYQYIPESKEKKASVTTLSNQLIAQFQDNTIAPIFIKFFKQDTLIGCRQGLYSTKHKKLLLKDVFISDIIEDYEGNIWVGSTNGGLYKIPNLEHEVYPINKSINGAHLILFNDNRLFYSDRRGNIYRWDAISNQFYLAHQAPNLGELKSILYIPNTNEYVCSGNYCVWFDSNFTTITQSPGSYGRIYKNGPELYKPIYQLKTITYGPIHTFKASFKSDTLIHYDYFKKNSSVNGYGIITFKPSLAVNNINRWGNKLLCTVNDSLYLFKDIASQPKIHPLPKKVIKTYIENHRFFIEFPKKIIEYDSIGQPIQTFSKSNYFNEDITNFFLDDDYLCLSTHQAIYLFDATTFKYIHHFTTDNGIYSLDFDKAWIYKGALFINGSMGISKISLKPPFKKGKPQLWIKKVYPKQQKDFNYQQNDIQIALDVRSFSNQGKLSWRLNGKAWNKLSPPFIVSLNELQYGKYTFEAFFKNDFNQSTPIIRYEFTIHPPFWQTWWFFALINLLLIGSIVFWVRRRIQHKRQQERQQYQVDLLRMQALQTQMNPHFIFNVQAAIQGLWLEDKDEAALSLQTHFSKLLRQIFQYSGQTSISIEQLSDFLDNYLELERIRFEENVVIDFEVDQTLYQEEYFIPPLLIQPIVENSFKHGLLHKKNDRQLLIFLEKQNDYLYCLVKDNGVGRSPAAMNRSENRASGLKTTKERLLLLQKSSFKTPHPYQNIKITDLKDKDGQANGTQVELWIPFVNFSNNTL